MAPKAQTNEATQFDFNKMFPDFNKYVSDFKVPNLDVEGLMTTQRKNLEALAAANRLAVEATQAVFKRQSDIMRQTLEQIAAAGRDVTAAGSVPEKAAKQTEIAKDQFERTVANMREVAEMVARSNAEAADLLNKRFSESLDEFRDLLLKMKG